MAFKLAFKRHYFYLPPTVIENTFFTFFQNPKNVTFYVFLKCRVKKRKNVESLIQVSCTQIRLSVSDDYKIGYLPKCRPMLKLFIVD